MESLCWESHGSTGSYDRKAASDGKDMDPPPIVWSFSGKLALLFLSLRASIGGIHAHIAV